MAKMLIYAHRGSSSLHPENTLRGFQHALDCGVDGVELDVHATSDNIPVVIHDRSVERTTNGSGYVDEIPLARLKTFDAGSGEHVPTLDEVLELVGGSVHIDMEIKRSGIEHAVLEVLSQHPNSRWAISSFDWNILRTLRRLDPSSDLWPLASRFGDDLMAIAAELESSTVALAASAYIPASAASLRDAGLHVMGWTVNSADEARRVSALGIHALCTDDPESIMALNLHE